VQIAGKEGNMRPVTLPAGFVLPFGELKLTSASKPGVQCVSLEFL